MLKMRMQLGVLLFLVQWVVYSDAWFWSWTGTTTLAPAVDNEGSGSPAGSGEPPPPESIARVGAEIIDERHGIQKIVETLDETTEAPRLTTSIQLETHRASEKKTAGISSHIQKPGNGASSLKGVGSEGSVHVGFTGDVSGPGFGLESDLASDTGSGLWSGSGFWSESGFATGPEVSWGSGFETQGFSEENQYVEVIPTGFRGLESEDTVGSQTNEIKLKFQKSVWINRNEIDEGQYLGSTKPEQNLDIFVESPDNIVRITKDNQLVEVNQLPASESAAKQEALTKQELHTRQPSNASWALSTTQTPTKTPEMIITQQTASKKPDTTSVPIATQPQVPSEASETREKEVTSHTVQILNASQTSVSEHQPSQATPISKTAEGTWATAESHTELIKPALVVESPKCLLIDADLPFCTDMIGERFAVPNYLNQSSLQEVQVILNDWAWLLRSNCHHSLEWFFCLLLVPKCSSLVQKSMLPCRSFCEVLRDSCWTILDEGRLPVECHILPDEEEDGYQCLSVSNQKGNNWFK